MNPKLPSPSKRTVVVTLAAVLLVATFGVGFSLGSGQLYFTGITPHLSIESGQRPPGVDLRSFWRVYNDVSNNFDGKVDKQKLIEGATKGLVESLGDPYSDFFSASENKDFSDQLAGKVEGIGAEVGIKDGVITVISPLDGSPAQKAGIKSGDQVLKIDGKSTDSMGLSQAILKIRGTKGTKVTLTIGRKGFTQPTDFTITRDVIEVPSVKYEVKDNNIAYVQITEFGNDTSSLFKSTMDKVAAQHPKGIVLDLRGDPGGYLTAAVDVATEFIPNGKVVVQEKVGGKLKDTLKAKVGGRFTSDATPLVVLVDGGSASASEIVSGALQDYKRGYLMGTKTFGKGSVQDLISLPGDTALKLTVAHWFTPNGHGINEKGLTPDKTVPTDATGASDSQLQAALSYLSGR